MSARLFRKRSSVVDALQFTKSSDPCGTNLEAVLAFIGGDDGERFVVRPPAAVGVLIKDGGTAWARPGDWITRGPGDLRGVCPGGIFDEVYEPVPSSGGGGERAMPGGTGQAGSPCLRVGHEWGPPSHGVEFCVACPARRLTAETLAVVECGGYAPEPVPVSPVGDEEGN